MVEGYAWPLHPVDDLAQVERAIVELFADMRIHDCRIIDRLLRAQRTNGAALYPRCDEYDALASGAVH
jgi:hypothetical protein